MKKGRISLFCFLGMSILLFSFSFGLLSEALEEKLNTYSREQPIGNLYVHTDRNNYMPGDTVWFKAYMLSGLKGEVLYVRITDNNKKVVMQKQLPIYDIRAHGDIALSDTLSDGKYFFYAYTDLMLNFNPEDVFVQPITISANIPDKVEMEAFATNSDKIVRGGKVQMGLKVKEKGLPVKGAKGEYSIWVADKIVKAGALGTNSRGETFVNFTYPKILDSQTVRFEAKLNEERQYASLSLNLRHEGSSLKINVYPEGGRLLEGVPNNVVFQVLDDNKNPIVATLVLKEGSQEIGSIETSKWGIGKILFKPKKDLQYSMVVKEYGSTQIVPLVTNIEKKGYGLRLDKEKDQHSGMVYNKGGPGDVVLVLRALNKLLWSDKVALKEDDSVRVALPTQGFPKEVLSLAVFDPRGIPVAERLFMNKADEPGDYRVQIDTVKQSYNKHDKIKVNLTITDQTGNPVETNLSIAVIEKSTLYIPDYRNILHSFYFHHLSDPNILTYDESDPGFDALMISKNWGKYDWKHIIQYRPTNSIRILANTGGVTGLITPKNKKSPGLLQLLLWSKSGPEPIEVNENGYFSLPPEKLMVNQFESKYLILGADFYEKYDIKFLNQATEFDSRVKAGTSLNWSQPFHTFAKYQPPPLKMFGGIQLKEVTISANGKDPNGRKRYSTCNNNCGDYVCKYKVLNCSNHPCVETPVIGIVYGYTPQMPVAIYNGCGKPPTRAPSGSMPGGLPAPATSLPLQQINYPSTFFLPDYSGNAFIAPDIRTTIFWSPNLNTDVNGKTSFEFYTSDIKSDFMIVVQGIDINTLRPVYYLHNLKDPAIL